MSTEIAGRPVLRPAGNIAVRTDGGDGRPALRKATKPPPIPAYVKPAPISKPSPNSPSKPPSPKTPPLSSQSRSPVLKPAPLNPQHKLFLPQSPRSSSQLEGAGRGSASKIQPASPSLRCAQQTVCLEAIELDCTSDHASATNLSVSADAVASAVEAASVSSISVAEHTAETRRVRVQSRKVIPNVSLTRSSGDVFQKSRNNIKAKPQSNVSKFGSLSMDESACTSSSLAAAKKAAAMELHAQKKLRIAEYGRKQGKASRVAPDVANLPPLPMELPTELKRCKFITSQSDPAYVAYHDEEWGVPIHDDRLLFELLVLVGAQLELSWPTILSKRDAYRDAFAGFDPAMIARFNEKHIQALEADQSLIMNGGRIRGVVENAQRILEIQEEFGSFDKYIWGFLNHKPMINNYQYPKQVPVKTSKSETISKDFIRRGFRFVGPTIIYSFMQAAGMTNDHLVQCFRHRECAVLVEAPKVYTPEQEQEPCIYIHEQGEESNSMS